METAREILQYLQSNMNLLLENISRHNQGDSLSRPDFIHSLNLILYYIWKQQKIALYNMLIDSVLSCVLLFPTPE